MSSRRVWREATAAFAAYALIALWWLWPLPLVASDHLAYFSAESHLVVSDVNLNVWALAWGAHAIVTQPLHLFDANSFYPSPFPLAYSEHMLGYLPFFAPTYWLTGNPVLAANVMIFSTYPLAGLGAFLLARRFTSAPAAAIAGVIYAFYPTRLFSLAHMQHLAVMYIPLALLFTERWLDEARRRDAVGVAISLALQLLSSFYMAYAAALAYGAYFVLALVRWRARLERRRLIGLAIALGCAAIPFLLASIPYVMLRRWGFIPAYGGDHELVPLAIMPFMAARHVGYHLAGDGVGPAIYVLTALGLISWKDGPWPRVVGLALVVLGVLVAFGPTIQLGGAALWSPYELLQKWVPGFAAVRMPRRFLVIAQLGFALLAALGLHRLLGWLRASMAWPAAVAAALAVLASSASLPAAPVHAFPVGDTVPPAYAWLGKNADGRPLLEIPRVVFSESARRMYLSSFHWLPIMEGYSAYVSDSPQYIYRLAEGLPDPAALHRLTSVVDVGWILVHRDRPHGNRKAWDGPLPEGMERAAEFGDDLVVKVTLPLRFDARERLFNASTSLDGAPLAPLGDDCPGAIRLIAPSRRVWEAGAPQPIRVAIENHGDRPWPGLGFLPRHLVRGMACLALESDEPCISDSQPLLTDVPAHGEVELPLLLKTPRYAGDYVLHVRLVQAGDEMLEKCGFTPLREPVRIASRLKDGPGGSYWESCRDCKYDGTTLTCRCEDGEGGERELSTSEPCPKGYANRNGALDCEGTPS